MDIAAGIEIAVQNLPEDDLIEPQTDLDPANERLIGVMSLRLKRLFSLAHRYDRMVQEAEERMDTQLAQEEKVKVFRTFLVCGALSEIVSTMLSLEVIERFTIWKERPDFTVNFRRGWQIVAVEHHNVLAFPVLEADELHPDPHAWQ